MNKSKAVMMLVGVSLVGLPQLAWANAGTPLMWAGMIHLVAGNLALGIFEGILLRAIFKRPLSRTIPIMIGANYLSAWVGGLLVCGSLSRFLPVNLENGWSWFWGMTALAYLLTLALEWPLVAACFRGDPQWRRKSLQASVVVQTVSYVLLFGWYWAASGTSLYTDMNIVSATAMQLPSNVEVYYIGRDDGDVYRRLLDGGAPEKLLALGSSNWNDRVTIRRSEADTNHWDIVARLDAHPKADSQWVTVLSNQDVVADPGRDNDRSLWFDFMDASSLVPTNATPWEFRTGFWAVEGITAINNFTGERVRFAWETPFTQWTMRSAIQLPTDKVLFQLGRDQICVFDPATEQVALLGRGRGPLAVIRREPVIAVP